VPRGVGVRVPSPALLKGKRVSEYSEALFFVLENYFFDLFF
jgi:hypothetical protein